MSVKVAVIGAGGVGVTLGDAMAKNGAEVRYGVRNPDSEKTQKMLQERPPATVAEPVVDAVAWADAIVLATPGSPTEEGIKEVAASLGPGTANKVILDATNPLSAFQDGLQVRWGQPTSGGEVLQEALPDAAVYKAFNTIGVEHMAAADGSQVTGEQLTMLFCGSNDAEKKELASTIIAKVGFTPVYCGPIRYARNLEAIAELWIHEAIFNGQGRNFHYQFIKKPEAGKAD